VLVFLSLTKKNLAGLAAFLAAVLVFQAKALDYSYYDLYAGLNKGSMLVLIKALCWSH